MFVEKNELFEDLMFTLEGIEVTDSGVIVKVELESATSFRERNVDVNAVKGPDSTRARFMERLLASARYSAGGAVWVFTLFEAKKAANFIHMEVAHRPVCLEEAKGEVTSCRVRNTANWETKQGEVFRAVVYSAPTLPYVVYSAPTLPYGHMRTIIRTNISERGRDNQGIDVVQTIMVPTCQHDFATRRLKGDIVFFVKLYLTAFNHELFHWEQFLCALWQVENALAGDRDVSTLAS